jgi:hypothetical protein
MNAAATQKWPEKTVGDPKMPLVAIQSVRFPNAFLRMDGSNVTQFKGAGSGTVNCQYYSSGSLPRNNSSDYEHFIEGISILSTSSHNNYYNIMSGEFPGVFLRIDGSNVTKFEGAGSGTVNCQFYPPGSWPSSTEEFEVFNIISL